MASYFLLKSVKTLLYHRNIYVKSKRSISYLLTKLNDRQLIRLNGKDSYDYIQGLVTNDLRHLTATNETSVTLDCIHAFMLNTSGRVVTDLFIYRSDYSSEDKQLFLEIDGKLIDSITKFLTKYRVRRKVSVNVEKDFSVYSIFPLVSESSEQLVEQKYDKNPFEDTNNENIIVVKDPRLKELGFRLLVKSSDDRELISDQLKSFLTSKNIDFSETDSNSYHNYRYRLGVGEGVDDFPVESCFPLECNGDYLHGVSFHKGCYVGQELTARIHHTGIVRKRLMPIEIISSNKVLPNICVQNVETFEGKTVGKFRNNCGKYGLSLLRVEDCLKQNDLRLSDSKLVLKTWKPFWWPKEINK